MCLICWPVMLYFLSVLTNLTRKFFVLAQLNHNFIQSLVILDQLRYLKRLVCVKPVLLVCKVIGFEYDGFRIYVDLVNVLVFELELRLLAWRSQQANRVYFYCQPHVVRYLQWLSLQLFIRLFVGLHIKQVRSIYGVMLDPVQNSLWG